MSDIALALIVCFAPVLIILAGIAVADYFSENRRAYKEAMATIDRPMHARVQARDGEVYVYPEEVPNGD
jgi:hypothetical protein